MELILTVGILLYLRRHHPLNVDTFCKFLYRICWLFFFDLNVQQFISRRGIAARLRVARGEREQNVYAGEHLTEDCVLSICKSVGVSPPIRVYAHSEVHASAFNQLDTLFSNTSYKDANGAWHLFDQALWRIESPYNVDTYFFWQFRNFGP